MATGLTPEQNSYARAAIRKLYERAKELAKEGKGKSPQEVVGKAIGVDQSRVSVLAKPEAERPGGTTFPVLFAAAMHLGRPMSEILSILQLPAVEPMFQDESASWPTPLRRAVAGFRVAFAGDDRVDATLRAELGRGALFPDRTTEEWLSRLIYAIGTVALGPSEGREPQPVGARTMGMRGIKSEESQKKERQRSVRKA